MSASEERIAAETFVDGAELREALGRTPGSWTAERLDTSGASGTICVARVASEPPSAGEPAAEPWSAILKVLGHSPEGGEFWLSGDTPDHWYYWRREALAYRSGLTDSFTGGLRGPRLFASFDRERAVDGDGPPEPAIALWLEDVAEGPAAGWDLDRYHLAARHLGLAQGAVPAGARALPDDEWLSRDWVRRYLERRAEWLEPLLAEQLPEVEPRLVEESRRLWADRHDLLSLLDAAPRTLCHFDAHPDNFFAVGDDTVLTDWSFVGHGPVGEDPGVLVSDALLDFHVEPGLAPDLLEAVWDGYASGLGESGWRFDVKATRMAVLNSAVVRYPWIAPSIAEARRRGSEQLNRWPREEAVERWEPSLAFLFGLADEARRLAGS